MDSLDATPSAEYASLLNLTMTNSATQQEVQFGTFDRNQNLSKPNQEHIYAQVAPNVQCPTIQPPSEDSKPDVETENRTKVMPNKMFMNNTILIRNPTIALSHANSAPDVRRPYPNLLNLYQNNYGSLNVTKEKDKSLVKKSESITDSSVFSISGRRVVVSNGFNGNGNNKQINNVKVPDVTPNLPNE